MIETWSKFNYGFDVESGAQYLDVIEGDVTITAEVEFGNYTLGEGLDAVQDALNAVGHNTYSVTVDRTTNLVTIAADEAFSLPVTNGPSAASSIFSQLGFVAGDLSGAASYTATKACGNTYNPQFLLQDYVPPEHYIESVDSSVIRAASGRIEVVRFGEEEKLELNLCYITNNRVDNVHIKYNETGVEDCLQFLRYITQKKRFEFIPDVDEPSTLHKVILESFSGFSKGTGFKLKELYTRGLAGFYETGVMELRVVS